MGFMVFHLLFFVFFWVLCFMVFHLLFFVFYGPMVFLFVFLDWVRVFWFSTPFFAVHPTLFFLKSPFGEDVNDPILSRKIFLEIFRVSQTSSRFALLLALLKGPLGISFYMFLYLLGLQTAQVLALVFG